MVTLMTLMLWMFAAQAADDRSSGQRWTYPGAADEEELVVQADLIAPAEKLERSSQIEQIRNNLFKKSEKPTDTQE